MTWIKTVSMEEDERVKKAMLDQRKLYPVEYATPVPAVDHGIEAGIVASHSLFPDVMFHSFSAFGAMMSPELPVTFGVGKRDQIDRATIDWPSGRNEEFKNLGAGTTYQCIEGKGLTEETKA